MSRLVKFKFVFPKRIPEWLLVFDKEGISLNWNKKKTKKCCLFWMSLLDKWEAEDFSKSNDDNEKVLLQFIFTLLTYGDWLFRISRRILCRWNEVNIKLQKRFKNKWDGITEWEERRF